MKTSKIAAIQMASGPNVSANLIESARLIADAAQAGANLIVLPENFSIMGMTDQDTAMSREPHADGPVQAFLHEQAQKNHVWIVAGTVPIADYGKDRFRAACLIIDDKGNEVARYDKIHLFDVHLSESSETYNESETVEPGNEVVVVETPFGKIGIAVCYDLRFPELFRQMVAKGAEIFVIPSSFTAITGKAHWEVLLRARAVENLSYVIASAQGGYHVNGRETYGNSMIVDPWGQVLDRLSSGTGFVMADIDLENVTRVRNNFPALEHRKMTCGLTTG